MTDFETSDNWKEFFVSCLSYFILIIIYAVFGANVVTLAKIFPATFIRNGCENNSLTYMEYLYPTDNDSPPYAGEYDCDKTAKKIHYSTKTPCAYTDETDVTTSGQISRNPDVTWSFLDKFGMSSVKWPYTWLYIPTDKDGSPMDESGLTRWFKYKFANIIYEAYYWNRYVFS